MSLDTISILGSNPSWNVVNFYKCTFRALMLFLPLCLWLSGCQPMETKGISARVQRIISGDTLEVVGTGSRVHYGEIVHLIGIDAPELGQSPWDEASRAFLNQKIILDHPTVILEMDQQPMEGDRRLAYVWIGKTLLNEAILAEGHALAVVKSPNMRYSQRLLNAQDRARQIGLGIWNPDSPLRTTPHQFRRQPVH
ncbi:MAG: thermonuclease family protein, partial [Synechococcales bacterium]|nr:thermonuclease family protein [Synechococcales bacterium]